MRHSTKYIVSPIYDHLFFIWPPMIFLGLGALAWWSGASEWQFSYDGHQYNTVFSFALAFTMAHVFAVFFRTHLNKQIFQLYPYRFTVVPLLFFLGLMYSQLFFVFAVVFIVWFDVYHSSMQTFGFGRIYDMRAGNDATKGRRLDYFLALFMYAGPILAGVSLFTHIDVFARFESIDFMELAAVPGWAEQHNQDIAALIIISATVFLGYYLYSYWKLYQNGYTVSWPKVMLFSSLTVCSVQSWAFNSFGQAFFIMECFHALQYFAMVWWSEKSNMQTVFHTKNLPFSKQITFTIFFSISFSFGIFAVLATRDIKLTVAVLQIVQFLHYWYDGFVWSVRKKQVA